MGGTRRYRNREHFSVERGSFPHNPRTLDKSTDGTVAWMQPDLKDSLQIHKNSATGEHKTNSDELVKKYTMVQIYRYRVFYHSLSRQLLSPVLHTHKCILQHLSVLHHGQAASWPCPLVSFCICRWLWAKCFPFSTLPEQLWSARSAEWPFDLLLLPRPSGLPWCVQAVLRMQLQKVKMEPHTQPPDEEQSCEREKLEQQQGNVLGPGLFCFIRDQVLKPLCMGCRLSP